jgi:hypothetical protein
MNYLLAELFSGLWMLCFCWAIYLNAKGSYIGFVMSVSMAFATFILLWIMFTYNEEIKRGLEESSK